MHTLTPILAQASSNNETAAALGVLLALIAGFGMIILAGYAVAVIVMWKVFTKAGQPGWAVLIPVYNIIVLLRVAGLPWYWVFAVFLPIIPILGFGSSKYVGEQPAQA